MTTQAVRLGVAGLGRAFTIMLPTLLQDPRIRLLAGADPLEPTRRRFKTEFNAPAFASVEELCALPGLDAIYVATPHQFHADHVCLAAANGKHVVVEKPMAITLAECTRMVEAARTAGVHLLVGPSHSYDQPILRTRQLIESGCFGEVRMITAQYYTDFLYRPRRPEELRTDAGGGVVLSQGAHQIDVIRMLAGGLVETVRARTGSWDKARPTEGAYSALLGLAGGAFCTATYSGYAHYDTDLLLQGIGESGEPKNPDAYAAARRHLETAESTAAEAALKARRNFGGDLYQPPSLQRPGAHPHFGHIIVSCDAADLRPTPTGIEVFADRARTFVAIDPPPYQRKELIDELVGVLSGTIQPLHTGEWGRATTEVCLGILASASRGTEVEMRHQVQVATTH